MLEPFHRLKAYSNVPKYRKGRERGTDSQNLGSWMLILRNIYTSIMSDSITKEWEDEDIIIGNQYSFTGKGSCHPKNEVGLVLIRLLGVQLKYMSTSRVCSAP